MEGLPFNGPTGEWLRKALLVVIILLAVFLGLKSLAEAQGLRYVGTGIQPTNTISVSGYGEVFAAPDIATFSFTVSSKKSTVAAAQAEATQKINAVTEYLKGAGVEAKDLQTTDYSINPQYEYQNASCPASSSGTTVYCPGGRSILTGYEVRQTTSVKVRDTAKAGDLLAGVGGKGATEVSGLSFTFDDPQKVQDDARGKAIDDAKNKAEELADQLGVRIVRVVSFSEGGNYNPMPYAKLEAQTAGRGAADAAVAPQIEIGQNKVTSNVSVTYEIR
jgi:uncharacterized protein